MAWWRGKRCAICDHVWQARVSQVSKVSGHQRAKFRDTHNSEGLQAMCLKAVCHHHPITAPCLKMFLRSMGWKNQKLLFLRCFSFGGMEHKVRNTGLIFFGPSATILEDRSTHPISAPHSLYDSCWGDHIKCGDINCIYINTLLCVVIVSILHTFLHVIPCSSVISSHATHVFQGSFWIQGAPGGKRLFWQSLAASYRRLA